MVADAGMFSETNQVARQAAGLSFILGARMPYLPDVVCEWRDTHAGEAVPDGLALTQPWPATSTEKARGFPTAWSTTSTATTGLGEHCAASMSRSPKPNPPSMGNAPVKRNRYIQLTGATKSVNRDLEAKTRALAGWKGYTTNLVGQPAEFVIDAYHHL